MSGTREGDLKAAAANTKHDKDFYRRIGRMGGRNSHTGGFASNKVDKNGLTGPERARLYGKNGGLNGSRLGIKNGEGKSPSSLSKYRKLEVINV